MAVSQDVILYGDVFSPGFGDDLLVRFKENCKIVLQNVLQFPLPM